MRTKTLAVCIVLISSIILISNTATAYIPFGDWQDHTGIFDVTIVENTGPELSYYKYSVLHPTDMEDNSHPIIVFCRGAGENAHPLDEDGYRLLLESWASHGFVVIAGNGSDQAYDEEAQAGLNWILDQHSTFGSPYYNKLITSSIASVGHSRGGCGAIRLAINDSRVSAILAIQVYSNLVIQPDFSLISVPIFYAAGEDDPISRPCKIHHYFDDTTNAPSWFAAHRDVEHITLYVQCPEEMQDDMRAFLYIHLFLLSPSAGAVFYGENYSLDIDYDDWVQDYGRFCKREERQGTEWD